MVLHACSPGSQVQSQCWQHREGGVGEMLCLELQVSLMCWFIGREGMGNGVLCL